MFIIFPPSLRIIIYMNIYCPDQQSVDDQQTSEIIKDLLDQSKSFKSLSVQMIMEIMVPFKIQVNPMMDQKECLNRIKDKIIDIILDEKEQCVAYLTLPKFKNLSQHTKRALQKILEEVWQQFQNFSKQKEQNKKCGIFFCSSKNNKQIEVFHLGLFNFFKTSFFYGCMGSMNNQQQFFPPNFGGNIIPNQNSQAFPPLPFNQMENIGSHFLTNINQPIQPINNDSSNKQFQQNNSSSRKIRQEKQVKVQQNLNSYPSHKIKNDDTVRNQYSQLSRPSKRQKKTLQEKEAPTPKPKFQELDSATIIDKNFSKCRCKGKFTKDKRFFECNECSKRLHLSCLRIPLEAVRKPDSDSKCPQCLLKKNNVFYQILGQPIQSLWIDQKEFSKFKMTLKGKRAQEIIHNNYSIQLRFLKFTGKTIFQWQNSNDAPPKRSPVFNEIIIKNDMLNKGIGDEIKICLQSGVKQVNPGKNQTQKIGPMIYAVAFIVRSRNVQQILNDQFEQVEENYLDKFFKGDETQLKIQILDGDFKLIENPVRGINCEHANVFDLEELLTHVIQLSSDSCLFCPKKCQNFKIDTKIKKQIQRIKTLVDDPERYPSQIYYHKDGTFTWKQHMAEQDQMNQGEDIGSDDIGVDIQEDFNNLDYSGDQNR